MTEEGSNGNGEMAIVMEQDLSVLTLRGRLTEGFRYLTKLRDAPHENPTPDAITPLFLSRVIVNFMDPTATSIMAKKTSSTSLCNNLIEIMEKEYANTLTYLPYTHRRSGAGRVIDRVLVHPLRTASGLVSVDSERTDAEFLHTGPFCHVYVAPCEGIEHYRTTVKPSIQGFVSQLLSSEISTRYMIVYIPTGERVSVSNTSTEEAGGTRSRVGAAFASRMAAARQRMTAAAREESPNNTSITDSNHTDVDSEPDTQGNSGHGSNVQSMNKTDKEVLRRLRTDFPGVAICTFTTLQSPEDDGEESLRKVEFGSFLKSLGSTIAEGFNDRIQRYDDELRKLLAQRTNKQAAEPFNLSNLILVKESLAFSYEQMGLAGEALLQYEELRAFIPDIKDIEHITHNESQHNPTTEEKEVLGTAAIEGDCFAFRRLIKGLPDFFKVVDELEHYLFVREISLLFKTNEPVEVVKRCFSFVESVFLYRQELCHNHDEIVETQKWAFEFCWDAKLASDCYFKASFRNGMEKGPDDIKMRKTVDPVVRCFCDLLDFARLRLLSLGASLELSRNVARSGLRGIPMDLQTPWEPWQNIEANGDESAANKNSHDVKQDEFLDAALTSESAYLQHSLELVRTLASYNEYCGRHRYSSRLRIEMMEIYMRQGEKWKAIDEGRSVVDVYESDQWHGCQFLLLFRMAALLRTSGAPAEYLDILSRCFTEATVESAPRKAREVLHQDLEAVVDCPAIMESPVVSPPLFAPALGLEGFEPTRGAGSDRNILKKVYSVGDRVTVSLALVSHLPIPVHATCISVSLVPFQEYVAALEDSQVVTSESVYRTLSIHAPVQILPGKNKYFYEWVPMEAGQYVLSSIEIQWKRAKFVYTAQQLRLPTIRADVVPCDHSQKLDLEPKWLMPGHEQPVMITFDSGSDVVKEGTIQLVGSPGLLVRPEATDQQEPPWLTSCEISLPPCEVAQQVTVTAFVKAAKIAKGQDDQSVKVLHAKLHSLYRRPSPSNDSSGNQTGDIHEWMSAGLESQIPALGHSPLVVEGSDLTTYSYKDAIVDVQLRSNLPSCLKLKSWTIHLPSYLALSSVGDMNESLKGLELKSGDQISFAFTCVFQPPSGPVNAECSLSVILENPSGYCFEEKLELGKMPRPHGWGCVLGDIASIPVQVVPSALSGLVCTPIDLVYQVDLSFAPMDSGIIGYTLTEFESDWIISGPLRGVLPKSNSPVQLKFAAFSSLPGTVRHYPQLAVSLFDEKGVATQLPVQQSQPEAFHCHNTPWHSTVAFPTPIVPRSPTSPRRAVEKKVQQ